MALPPIPDLPPLAGATVGLRPWSVEDIALVVEASHDELIPKITTVPDNAGEDEAREFIERQQTRPETDFGHARVITDLETDEAIGHLYMSLVRLRKRRAEIGYWIAPSRRRRGAASEALDLATTWAFAHLSLQRMTLYIEPWNDASIRTALRAGFTEDGPLRNWETAHDGTPRDVLAFGRFPPPPETP